jgi:hypothetical protein
LFRVADLALAVAAAAVLLVLGPLPWSDTSVSQHIDLMKSLQMQRARGGFSVDL